MMRICRWARFGCGRAAAVAGIMGLSPSSSILATREYPRFEVGIGRRDGAREITGHVLGRFDSTESAV